MSSTGAESAKNIYLQYILQYVSTTSRSHHSGDTREVICPICAVSANTDPNLMTDNLANHMTLEHAQEIALNTLKNKYNESLHNLIYIQSVVTTPTKNQIQ